MTESAFGVDHGEISKMGFKMPGSFKPKNPLATTGGAHKSPNAAKVGPKLKPTNPAQQFSQGFKNSQGLTNAKAKSPGMKMNKPTRAGVYAGQNKKPLVGGAAAGLAGGGGYTAWKMNKDKR